MFLSIRRCWLITCRRWGGMFRRETIPSLEIAPNLLLAFSRQMLKLLVILEEALLLVRRQVLQPLNPFGGQTCHRASLGLAFRGIAARLPRGLPFYPPLPQALPILGGCRAHPRTEQE